MAPEQSATPDLVLDHHADIYALGVVFYQMLTGELPTGRFDAPSKKVHIDIRLDEIVLRALEQNPELRYQNATQFKTEIETVANNPAIKPTPPPRGAGATVPSHTCCPCRPVGTQPRASLTPLPHPLAIGFAAPPPLSTSCSSS